MSWEYTAVEGGYELTTWEGPSYVSIRDELLLCGWREWIRVPWHTKCGWVSIFMREMQTDNLVQEPCALTPQEIRSVITGAARAAEAFGEAMRKAMGT